ncbi:MAG TPA: FtsX-like permease family protein, partial [Actinomycetota bacterium]|nr:FtsX-like permease family protein [Actinomycetota bacterium]
MLRAAIRSVLAHKVRLLLTAVSVVLGVGFMAGTYVLTDTMTSAFNSLIESGTGDVDVIVRSENAFQAPTNGGAEEREPMPESVVADIAEIDGVAQATGDVLGYAQIVDPATGEAIGTLGPPTIGSSWNPLSGFQIRQGREPDGADEVVIDVTTSETRDIAVGDTVQILFEGPPGEFEVVGTAGYGEGDSLLGATLAVFDLETAQQVMDREGQVDTVSVVAGEGTSTLDLQRAVAEVIPEGTEVVTAGAVASEARQNVDEGLGFFRTALLVFAGVALFVGAFIIFNTFAIIVAQRTRELALLRALGASRRQVLSSVILEALVVGVVASAVGVLAGIAIAIGLKGLLSATGFSLPTAGTVIQLRTIVVSIVVGTLVTLVAAILPARRAARVAPVEAMRAAQDTGGRSLRFRLITGSIVLTSGVVPLLYGLFGAPDNAIQLVGLGVGLTFIGVAMLTPLVSRPVAGALGAPIRATGVPARLGRENAMRNPRRTAATASALMIGLGLVVFVAVFGASAKASVTETLERTLKADFILTSATFSGFSTAAADDLRGIRGVAAVAPIRQGPFRVDGRDAFVSALDPVTFDAVADADVVDGSIAELAGEDTIALVEEAATDLGVAIGDDVEVEFAATGQQRLRVVAIYAEQGVLDDHATSIATYEANATQQLDTMVLVKAEDGVDVSSLQREMGSVLEAYPNVEVQDQTAFREKYATFLNQVLNLLTALLLMAVIIAVFGIVNTLSLSVYERTRELGLLRAVGLGRRQTRAMVRWEAVIIAAMGALFGVVIGIAFGWA